MGSAGEGGPLEPVVSDGFGGPEAVDNLSSEHRLHHNLKTDGLWTSEPAPDDGLEWTTLTGRTHTTHPKNWREGLDPPPF